MNQKTASKHLLVLCTCPDPETARRLGRMLVDGRLAACVNVVDGLSSVYRWKGAVQEDSEALMLIKTSDERYRDLEAAIVEHHPNELPEIIAVQIERGLEDYLDWIAGSGNASDKQ